MENVSHWTGAVATARNFDPSFSVLYARDHIEALQSTRLLIRPDEMTAEKWNEYKKCTALIGLAYATLFNLVNEFSRDYKNVQPEA